MNSLQAVFFVLNSFTISLKTLSFIFESMSHLVCLVRRRGSFGGGGRDFYRKQINEGSNWKEKSMQLNWRLTCATVHGINHFHSSDVPLIWQAKNTTKNFLNDLQIESFGFICLTFLVSFWSFKQSYVLCLS